MCDFVGHAFPTELSRALASRQHQVSHVHLAGFVVGKGPLERLDDDPPTLELVTIDLGAPFPKYRTVSRLLHELRFAFRLVQVMRRGRPDVIVLSTTPPVAQLVLVVASRLMGIPRIVWLQDLFGAAVASGGRQAVGKLTRLVTAAVSWVERTSLRQASHVIAISEGFLPFLDATGVARTNVTVIPNWASLSTIGPRPKRNPWSEAHELADVPVVLYAGTLGFKHDWTILRDLARHLSESGAAKLVVVSEGPFVDELQASAALEQLGALVVLPFQPFEVLPDVLATADVCLALLTPDAAEYSVPSKVQSYLAAGRPVLIAGSTSGDAARSVVESGAGLVVDDGDRTGLVAATDQLLAEPGERGARAWGYAEVEFDLDRKVAQFEQVFAAVNSSARGAKQ